MGYSDVKQGLSEYFRGHPGNISMDSNQAGATMASRYITAKNAAIVGASVIPAGALTRGGSAVTGSTAYKVYGYVKRPVWSIGVHQKIRGATTGMALSKAYSKMMIAGSLFNFGRNVQLARAKEYKRLGINVFGPPLSLFLYDYYMAHNMDAEAEISAVKEEQSRVGGSLPSKPKTRGNDSYRPSATRYLAYYEGGVGDHPDSICRKGYRYDRKRNLCVKKK
jgi:hypothetical protein